MYPQHPKIKPVPANRKNVLTPGERERFGWFSCATLHWAEASGQRRVS
jgi:hypothetical protein